MASEENGTGVARELGGAAGVNWPDFLRAGSLFFLLPLLIKRESGGGGRRGCNWGYKEGGGSLKGKEYHEGRKCCYLLAFVWRR